MDEWDGRPSIRVRRSHVRAVLEHIPFIQSQYSVLISQTKRDSSDSSFVYLPLEAEHLPVDHLAKIAHEVQVSLLLWERESMTDGAFRR